MLDTMLLCYKFQGEMIGIWTIFTFTQEKNAKW